MTATAQILPAPVTPAPAPMVSTSQDSGGFSFGDLLDVINPLQHIPVISTIYRALTGDKIGDVEKMAGDTLYGGLIGLGSAVADLVVRNLTGNSVGETVLAAAENLTGIHLDGDRGQSSGAPILATPQMLASLQNAPPSLNDDAIAPQLRPSLLASLQVSLPALIPDTSPQPVTSAQAVSAPLLISSPAVMAQAAAQGIDPALAMRALRAYDKTLGFTQ